MSESAPIGRIEILRGQPDEAETVAIVAAVVSLTAARRTVTPAPPAAPLSPWLRSARLDAHERLSSSMETSVWTAAADRLWPG